MGGVGYRDMYSGKLECFTPKPHYFHLSVQAKLTNLCFPLGEPNIYTGA